MGVETEKEEVGIGVLERVEIVDVLVNTRRLRCIMRVGTLSFKR